MTPTLSHCRTFHPLESFCFWFLAPLPLPQSFLLCNIDSTFHYFKYFEYFISSSLVSSSSSGIDHCLPHPPTPPYPIFSISSFHTHCVYMRLEFPPCLHSPYLDSVSLSTLWNMDIATPKIYSVKINNDLLIDKSHGHLIMTFKIMKYIKHFEEYRY